MKIWVGIYRGKEGNFKVECTLCGAECESAIHVLLECPPYSSCRLMFLEKLLRDISTVTLICSKEDILCIR